MLADHQVEAPARQGDTLCVRLDEREDRSDPPLQAPSRRQLLAGQVQRHRLGPSRGQPRREIGGSTPQFNHMEVSYVAQDAEEPVWNREQPPHHLRSRPQRVGRCVGKAFVQQPPKRSVLRNLGGPIIRHLAKVGARLCGRRDFGQSAGQVATATKSRVPPGGSGCGFNATKSIVVLGGSGCEFRARSLMWTPGGIG